MRTIGPPGDPAYARAAEICNATSPYAFTFGQCPSLIECVLDNVSPGYTAAMQAGGNIASLVPTTLALIGAPPLELVQLALISPHRAIATCCFSIGLPSGLFRQLRPARRTLSDKDERLVRQRVWTFDLPTASGKSWSMVRTIIIDLVTLTLAAVMLWYNWTVTNATMVTWRCEYGLLLFCWPIACIGWLVIAMLLLVGLLESVEVRYSGRPDQIHRGFVHVLFLPYRNTQTPNLTRALPVVQEVCETPKADIATQSESPGPGPERVTVTMAAHSEHGPERVTVTMTAHSEHGLRSWSWYEIVLESMAVGIYLYATLVLTSTLFWTGKMALSYAVAMTLSLSAIRIIGSMA